MFALLELKCLLVSHFLPIPLKKAVQVVAVSTLKFPHVISCLENAHLPTSVHADAHQRGTFAPGCQFASDIDIWLEKAFLPQYGGQCMHNQV